MTRNVEAIPHRGESDYFRSTTVVSSAGVVLLTISTAPRLGLTSMVNSVLTNRREARPWRPTAISTRSPGFRSPLVPLSQVAVQAVEVVNVIALASFVTLLSDWLESMYDSLVKSLFRSN